MSSEELTGSVAIVTGAASGIGAATARLLSERGAHTVLTDITPAVRDTAAALDTDRIRAIGLVADAARHDDWRLVAKTARTIGRVDIVVSNAYTVYRAPLHQMTREAWDRQLDVNLSATYEAIHALHDDLTAGPSSLVLVSSVHVRAGLPGHPAYAATKGALVALAQQLGVEYAPQLRVNCVVPGPVETAAWADLSEADKQRSGAQTALGRLGCPSEIAEVIAFLSSARASFVTGASWVADGGWTIVKDSA